jgi:hypothetical protein
MIPPRDRARYEPTLWLFQGGFHAAEEAVPPSRPVFRPAAEENIVAEPFDRYIAGAKPPTGRRPAALRRKPRTIGNTLAARRVAAPGDADRMNQKPSVFADATLTKNSATQ